MQNIPSLADSLESSIILGGQMLESRIHSSSAGLQLPADQVMGLLQAHIASIHEVVGAIYSDHAQQPNIENA
jgi:hypothetical protein